MKRVVLISNYFHLKQEKEINRYRILAERICEHGNIQLEVITSSFYQRSMKQRNISPKIIEELPYKFTTIFEPGYTRKISFQRLKSSRIFAKNVLKYLKTIDHIDLIYQVVPTLDVADKVTKFANKKRIPVIIDVQDLWPEAFRMALNIPIISSLLFWPYKIKANNIYKRADDICAVSKTYVTRALFVNKKQLVGHPVFIGVDLSTIDEYCKLQDCKKESEKMVIGYCGSLGKSYDLETVIRALTRLDNPPKLLIMGDGEKREKIRQMAFQNKLDVEFTGFIDYSLMCIKLRSCDMVVNPIIGESVASIINKHGDYAASGLPVLNTQNSKEYIDLINEFQMGLSSAPGDDISLSKNIQYLIDNAEVRKQMGENARKCAELKFDRKITYNELVNAIVNLL